MLPIAAQPTGTLTQKLFHKWADSFNFFLCRNRCPIGPGTLSSNIYKIGPIHDHLTCSADGLVHHLGTVPAKRILIEINNPHDEGSAGKFNQTIFNLQAHRKWYGWSGGS